MDAKSNSSMGLIMAPVAGLLLGVVLSFMSLALSGASDEMLLFVYVVVIFLVSASLASSPRAGLMLGLLAIAGETLAELVYFLTVHKIDVSLLPYAAGFVLFVGRIPLYPLAGAAGGYVGREYFQKEKQRNRGVLKKRRT